MRDRRTSGRSSAPRGRRREHRLRLARLVGQLLGRVLGALGTVRRDKPLHPRGRTMAGRLTTWGGPRPWGTPFLDEPGTTPCLVRLSRAAGFPRGWPDIDGVAVRLTDDGADLLFATTGTGRVSRFVLVPRRRPDAPMTTLLPLRSSRGPLVLRLTPEGKTSWLLSAASARGRWEPRGRLVLADDDARDAPVRFDPVHRVPRGLAQLPWVAAVRDPAYVLARRRPARAR